MIELLGCACGNTDVIANSILKRADIYDYDACPRSKGKYQCMQTLDILEEKGYDVEELRRYIAKRSSFIIFIGYMDGGIDVEWVDANQHGIEPRSRAIALIRAFAE